MSKFISAVGERLMNIIIALNQLINAALLGGYPDEAISSRSYRLDRDRGVRWPKRIVNAIFFWQDDHCRNAYDSEMERRHMPPEMRCKK
ncbi:hypothetical protein [Neptunomonas sp. XY-337]|uniref:hypothetical protein n=1 Tax=Neptunomonas sp. XY-337 TaxID=2561897 RepID=UPI00197FE2DE|nr:hypothetical protein [Neptunomonas sp. XY-337]